MSATDPYLMKDLVKKYGWEIQSFMNSIGLSLLGNGQILFVDHGHAQALDADDAYHGHRIDVPLDTIEYAIGLCTADQGDVILVAPGHTETISGAAGIDLDVDDVTIIGLGVRSKRPVISFSAAASTLEINADNVTIKNIQFVSTYTGGVTKAIDVKTTSNYVTIEGCRFYETANTERFTICVNLEDEVDFFTLKDCDFSNTAGGSNNSALFTEDDADWIVVEGCRFWGDWTNAILDLDANGGIVYPLVKNCLMVNLDTTAGAAILVNSGAVLVMVDLRVASGDANTYPVSDISASFQMGCKGCEVALEDVSFMGGATATSWAG